MGLPVYALSKFRMGSNFMVIYYTVTAINALFFQINCLFLIPVLFFQKKLLVINFLPVLVFFFYFIDRRNNEDSKNVVIKLSELKRYVLNESGQDNMLFSDEIDLMNNNRDLMKLRIGAKTRLNVNFPTEYKDLMIPHLLFVTFIENAFKYGISVQEESYVNISLEFGEYDILFKCENGLPESNKGSIFTSTGIGLENLKKRLNLLYPDRHELEINRTKNKFEVNLIIQL
jgi:LytS/YehU family sensor histidine kinase